MRVRDLLRRTRFAILATTMVVIAVPVSAQGPQTSLQAPQTPKPKPPRVPKWTFEIYGGGVLGPTPSGGTTATFPVGPTFTTDTPNGAPTRANPSWYFGDGAALFNQVNGQFASAFGINFPRMMPLDGMLTSQPTSRGAGLSIGVRLARKVARRIELEFAFDRSARSWTVSDEAADAIESSRVSFESAFNGLLATIPAAGTSVTSTASLPDAVTASQTSFTGAARLALMTGRRSSFFVTLGGGYASNSSEPLTLRLSGRYQFRLLDTYPFNEADSVTVTIRQDEGSPVGVFGAGYTWDVRALQQLRFDVRAHLAGSGIHTSVSATPSITRGTPAMILPSLTSPSIQFSSQTGVRSSLDGTLSNFEAFDGSGMEVSIRATVAYAFRF